MLFQEALEGLVPWSRGTGRIHSLWDSFLLCPYQSYSQLPGAPANMVHGPFLHPESQQLRLSPFYIISDPPSCPLPACKNTWSPWPNQLTRDGCQITSMTCLTIVTCLTSVTCCHVIPHSTGLRSLQCDSQAGSGRAPPDVVIWKLRLGCSELDTRRTGEASSKGTAEGPRMETARLVGVQDRTGGENEGPSGGLTILSEPVGLLDTRMSRSDLYFLKFTLRFDFGTYDMCPESTDKV